MVVCLQNVWEALAKCLAATIWSNSKIRPRKEIPIFQIQNFSSRKEKSKWLILLSIAKFLHLSRPYFWHRLRFFGHFLLPINKSNSQNSQNINCKSIELSKWNHPKNHPAGCSFDVANVISKSLYLFVLFCQHLILPCNANDLKTSFWKKVMHMKANFRHNHQQVEKMQTNYSQKACQSALTPCMIFFLDMHHLSDVVWLLLPQLGIPQR